MSEETKPRVTPRGTDSAKLIQVIETVSLRGVGTKENPVRAITQYWDLDGNRLAERDSYKSELEDR